MNCINCGEDVTGNFCSNCGQKKKISRITLKEGWNDFWSKLYGFDGVFFRTISDLTIRPGFVAQSFIKGNRVTYYGPISYFFLMVTLFIIILNLLGLDFKAFINASQETFQMTEQSKAQQEINQTVMGLVSENIRIVAFLFIPFSAIAAHKIFFRKSGLNFMENAVLPLYLVGHIYWITILSTFVFKLAGSFALYMSIPVFSILFFGYGYVNFNPIQTKWKAFVRGLMVYLFGQLFFVIAIAVVTIVVFVVLFFVNPDFFESLRPVSATTN